MHTNTTPFAVRNYRHQSRDITSIINTGMAGKYNYEKHNRRSIRLKGYDYTQTGAYFVTICTQNRECLFGEIIKGKMVLNQYGLIVRDCWNELGKHYEHVEVGMHIIMPNHIHGIINIVGAGLKPAPTYKGGFHEC